MRIDRYWKQAAAGLLAMMMFMTAGGGMDSFAMTDSQPFKAQGQALTAPDKIIIKDDQDHGQSSQSGQTAPVIQQIQSTNGQTHPHCLARAALPCLQIMIPMHSFCP